VRRVLLLGVVCLVGCGGGARQDADEPSGTFKVEVVSASFPKRQHIAQSVVMRVRVRNADNRDLRNVAVTIATKARGADAAVAFGQNDRGEDLSSAARPVWVLDRGPSGDTADVNTWSAGVLKAGETRDLTWKLTAVKAGTYTIGYSVAPGLSGRAQAATGRTSGSFSVTILDQPVPARVGADGQVERGVAAGGGNSDS
jgi:hypothetical protein